LSVNKIPVVPNKVGVKTTPTCQPKLTNPSTSYLLALVMVVRQNTFLMHTMRLLSSVTLRSQGGLNMCLIPHVSLYV